jgi:hypothetical protein
VLDPWSLEARGRGGGRTEMGVGNKADMMRIDRQPQGRDEGLSHHRTRRKGGS